MHRCAVCSRRQCLRHRVIRPSIPGPTNSRAQVDGRGTGASAAEKRIGSSLSSGPATPGVKGGAEKNSRYSGDCKKFAKNGLEKFSPAMA